jgi:hypothetical protein
MKLALCGDLRSDTIGARTLQRTKVRVSASSRTDYVNLLQYSFFVLLTPAFASELTS